MIRSGGTRSVGALTLGPTSIVAGRKSRLSSSTRLTKPSTQEFDREFGVQVSGLPFSETFFGPGASGRDHILVRNTEPTVKQLVEMRRNDGQARGLFRLLTMPVRAAAKKLTWVPAEGGQKEAKFAEALLTTPAFLGGMQTSFQMVIAQLLLSVMDGFSPFELVYTVPKRGPLQGKIALSKIAYRPSETIQFLVDDVGDFEGLRQRTTSPGGDYLDVKIDKDCALYYACGHEENPYYGVSYFNAAFYHYDKKVKLYYLAHLAAQHRAVGSRLGKYPLSASPIELASFRKALSDFGLAQAMSVPDKGWSVEDLGKSLGDFPFMDFVNHHNSQMSKSVLAPFLDDAQGGQKSIVDFGGQTDSMYQTLISVLISEIETLINEELIPRFIDWNFNTSSTKTSKYPHVKFGPFTDEQKHVVSSTFEKLATAGASSNVTRTFLLELEKHMAGEMGLEIDYKKITEALAKQEELSLKHFVEGAALPPPAPPFQAIGTNPADQQQGVPARAQWMPGPQQPNSQQSNPQQPGPPQSNSQPSGPSQPGTQATPFPSLPSHLSAIDEGSVVDDGKDGDDGFLGLTIVRVDAYTRVRNGQTEHVDGYYYDVQRGVKVSPSAVPGRVKTVSIHQAKALAVQAETKKSSKTSGPASTGSQSVVSPGMVSQNRSGPTVPNTSIQKFSPGTYHVSLPDGSITEVLVSKDGSSRSKSGNGKTEHANSEQTAKFLSYWKDSLQHIDKSDGSIHDTEHPQFNVGGVSVTAGIIQDAIDILSKQSSTSSSTALKAPLKDAGHPLADVNLRAFAEQHAGKLHYSKLKQGVIAALQDVLKGKSGSNNPDGNKTTPASSAVTSGTTASKTGVSTSAPLRVGMHLATQEDHARLAQDGIKLPPAWTNVQISDDHTSGLQAIGTDSKGRAQYVYSSAHTDRQSQAKFARIKALRQLIPAIDSALKKDASSSDHAAALLLIRRLGLRPGSDQDTGAEKKAFGATNMLVEHVNISGDTVKFDFTGKKGVALSFTTKDPELAAVLAARVEGKSPQEKLFETNEKRVAAYLHAIARGFKVKDLRTYYGTMFAFSIVESIPIPKFDAERKKARADVANQVSAKLGNTPAVALASYIDPLVFASWENLPVEVQGPKK